MKKTKKPRASSLSLVRNGSVPVYEQIAKHLLDKISSGQMPVGTKLPGTKILAKELGVNHLTLRQALQKLEQLGAVSMESGRGTFVIPRESETISVALILPNLNESSSRISAGVQEVLAPFSAQVSIFHFDENPELEREQLARLQNEKFDGAIVFPSLDPISLKPLLNLLIAGYPLVFIDRAPTELPCWSVLSDNFRGGFLAANRLLDAGCQRLACLATEIGTVHDRLEGFKRALNDRGHVVDHSLIHTEHSEKFSVETIVDQWLARPAPPDGIFFPNDFRASLGVRRLTQLGRRVPAEIKVVGFDNLSIAQLSLPSLTTVAQNFAQIGRTAAELLREMVSLEPEKRFVARREIVPVELIARESA
ncbi:MAG TPA: GntR family transcriptional regulator [Opitutaceae bacterium]|nr:GntR family transcriptional regulator [Opitutaceae bacterium]